jgi:hypothetical protein
LRRNKVPLTLDQLKSIDELVEDFFEKVDRTGRIFGKFRRVMINAEPIFLKVTEEFFDLMRGIVERDVRAKFRKARGNPDIFAEYVDWEEIEKQGKVMYKPAYVDVMAKGGDKAIELTRIEASFDVVNVNAIRWADKASLDLIKDFTKTAKNSLRKVVSHGIEEGLSYKQIAGQINLHPFDLNSNQLKAYYNMKGNLQAQGLAVTGPGNKLIPYYKKLKRDRATMIARTETSRAVNEGSLQGYEQVNIKNVERIEAADCCEVCAPESGAVYTIDAARGVLPAHPDCRGCWGASTRPASRRMPKKPELPTEEQLRESLEGYQDGGFQKINGHLRGEEINPKFISRAKADIRNLDLLMKKSTEDHYLFRGDGAGISADLFEKIPNLPHNIPAEEVLFGRIQGKTYTQFLNDRLKGITFTDKAFVSTSRNSRLAMENFVGGSTSFSKYGCQGYAEIMVKRGTKLIDVEKVSLMGAGESEMMLTRGLKYKIENVIIEPYQHEGLESRFYIKYLLSIVE